MLDLPWMLRRRTWWPTLEIDVCKPGCEKWSDAPLSIKRCDRHKMSVKLFMARMMSMAIQQYEKTYFRQCQRWQELGAKQLLSLE